MMSQENNKDTKIYFMVKKLSFEKDFAYCGRLHSETKCGNLGKVLWFSSNSIFIQPCILLGYTHLKRHR